MQRQVGAKSIQAVAIAYVMQKTPHVFPIVGCRKIEQLQANVEALDVRLSEEQIAFLESVLPFEPGFPSIFRYRSSSLNSGYTSFHFERALIVPLSTSSWSKDLNASRALRSFRVFSTCARRAPLMYDSHPQETAVSMLSTSINHPTKRPERKQCRHSVRCLHLEAVRVGTQL